MLKPIALAILMAASQASSAATSWSYDFSGDFGAHFDTFWAPTYPEVVEQTGGVLQFHTNGQQVSHTDAIYLYKDVSFDVSQSWVAQLDVSVPASLRSQPDSPTGETYASPQLIVATFNDDGSLRRALSIDLEVSPPYGSLFWTGVFVPGSTTDDIQAHRLTSDTAGTVKVSFDATTQQFTSWDPYGPLMNVTLADAGWVMNGTDKFQFIVGFGVENMFIPPDEVLSLDNLTVSLQPVPEPETYALMLAGLGLVGLAAQHRKYQRPLIEKGDES